MRTNYKRISNVLKTIASEVVKSRTNGLVAIFENELDGTDERVRVVLVEENQYQNEIGIHMTQIDPSDFSDRLISNIEQALKDSFPTIWVHQRAKDTKELRESKLRATQGWIKAFDKRTQSRHSLTKLNFDLSETLQTLNLDQIQALNALITASFHHGACETREFLNSLKKVGAQ